MSYRDDRHALRERAESLERELADARAELERLRGTAPRSVQAAGPALSTAGRTLSFALPVLALVLVLLLPLNLGLRTGITLISLTLLGLVVILSKLVVVARPNEGVVLAGRSRITPDGRAVGYRVVHGSRSVRMPMLESESRIDLAGFRVPLAIRGARDRDGQSVDLDLVVHARVSRHEPDLDRAIERLLGSTPQQRADLVATALDGTLRELVSALDAKLLNQDRMRIAAHALAEAEPVLRRFGIAPVAVYVLDVRGTGDA